MVDLMEVAMFFVVLDLMIVVCGVAVGDVPTDFKNTYSQFVSVNTNTEELGVNSTAFQNTVNLTPVREVNAIIGGILAGYDWVTKLISLLAWFAGSMILVPLTVLEKLQAPFIIRVLVGVPAVIMQMIIIIAAISGRYLHK